MHRTRLVVLLPLAMLAAGPASSQGLTFGAGIAATSDYDGDDAVRAALQWYVEVEHDTGLYAGLWASTLDPDTGDSVEFDLYAGLRGEAGSLSFDLGYTRYVYDTTGDCCGEAILALGWSAGDTLSLGVEIASDFAGGGRLAPSIALALNGGFEFGAEYTIYEGTNDTKWSISLTRSFDSGLSVGLEAWEATGSSARIAATVSFDTTLFGN